MKKRNKNTRKTVKVGLKKIDPPMNLSPEESGMNE